MTISLDDALKNLKKVHNIDSHVLVSKSVMFSTMLDWDRKYLRRCETLIKQHGDDLKNKTNLQSAMTAWDYCLLEPYFNPLLNSILQKFEKIIDHSALDKLELWSCWGAYYNKDDYAIRHDHKEAEWSFVYYVNVEKGSSSFDIHEDFEPFPAPASVKIEAETNRLIIFRGHTQHSVSPQKGDGERVVIAGNIYCPKPDSFK